MSDPSKNFGEAAKRYSAFRPDYPAAVFEFLTAHAASGRGFAVDLGAGSGQATRRLATLYDRVVAVEPDSRLAGDGAFAANVAVEVKAAEEADFPAGSVDAVISATAFHWMDQPLVCRHVARWLKPGGAFFPFAFDAFEVEGEAGEIYKSEFKKWAAYRDRRLIDCYDYLRAL
ncbi:MAG: class I SAM-dependent methyltransferase, partial [Parvularculaceae bacterium]